MKKLLFLLFILIHIQLMGKNISSFSIENVEIHSSFEHPFMIVTNRKMDINLEDKSVFLNHELDTSSIHYLIINPSKKGPQISVFNTFEEAFNTISHEHLVFHVHGFGNNFEATLRGGIDLQKQYGVNLILFDVPTETIHWNIFSEFKRTKNNYQLSVQSFHQLLLDYADVVKKEDEKPTLFLHSMGNYLLEKYLKSDFVSEKRETSLLGSVLINAPCVKRRRHKKWLEKINEDINVYVVLNENDFTLQGAEFVTFQNQLGGSNLKKKHVANNANYFSFKRIAKSEHNYYVNEEIIENKEVKTFYTKILQGEKINTSHFIAEENGIQLIAKSKI